MMDYYEATRHPASPRGGTSRPPAVIASRLFQVSRYLMPTSRRASSRRACSLRVHRSYWARNKPSGSASTARGEWFLSVLEFVDSSGGAEIRFPSLHLREGGPMRTRRSFLKAAVGSALAAATTSASGQAGGAPIGTVPSGKYKISSGV